MSRDDCSDKQQSSHFDAWKLYCEAWRECFPTSALQPTLSVAALDVFADKLRTMPSSTASSEREQRRIAIRIVDTLIGPSFGQSHIDKVLALLVELTMPSATGRTLEEALHRCADYHGDDALLDAPCIFCGYNGAGYWQKGTHSKDCRLSDVGGFDDRRKALLRREQSDIGESRG